MATRLFSHILLMSSPFHSIFFLPLVWLFSYFVHTDNTSLYRTAGYFRGVLIFVIFVTNPGVTKFCTHEVFHLCYKLLVLLLT